MIKHQKLTVYFLIILLLSTTALYAVDLHGEFQFDKNTDQVGGGISLAVSEKIRNSLSLDGNLKYLGSNCYDASCVFYYTKTVFAIGGGFTFKLEKNNMYPGIKFSTFAIPISFPLSFDLSSSLFYKPNNLLSLHSLCAGLGLTIHTENSNTKLIYDFRMNIDNSLLENKASVEVEAFQEGIPFRFLLFGSANFINTDTFIVQSQAGGSFLWQTKNGITFILKGIKYITGREYNDQPEFSITAGIKLQLE